MAVLLFDLDDTLMAEVPAATAAFAATAAHAARLADLDAGALAATARVQARRLWQAAPVHPYCLRVGISSSEALWCRFEGGGEEIRWLRGWAPRYRRETWAAALAEQGLDDPRLAEELAARFGEERRARHEVFPDVVPVLAELAARHRLALVTNGASCLQREKLAASGLAGFFEAVVISGDVGVGKPDAEIFRVALDRLGGDPADAWMIGDTLDRDIDGALAAGLRAVWVDREARPGTHAPRLASLAGLPSLVAGED